MAAILSLTARPPGVSLPGLTVHDSAPALVVKSGNLAARPVWEGVKGGGGWEAPGQPAEAERAPAARGWPPPVAWL